MDINDLGYFEIWLLVGVVAAACTYGIDKRSSPFELLWVILAGPLFPAFYMLAICWGMTRVLPLVISNQFVEEINELKDIINIQAELIDNQRAILKTDEVQSVLKEHLDD